MLITLGIRLGYQRLILCGVDLNRADYFFEDIDRYPNAVGFRNSNTGPIHDTLVQHRDLQAIDEVLYTLIREVLDRVKLNSIVKIPNPLLYRVSRLLVIKLWSR